MKSNLYSALILLLVFLVNEIANAQSGDTAVWAWAKSLSATNAIYGHAIEIDPNGSGDVYIAGGFEGTTDFDPGPGTFILKTGSPGDVGIFVSKYNGLSDFVWARAMVGEKGTSGSPYSMAIDPTDGAIYTTGRFQGTVDFDPSPTSTFELTAVGANDIFVSKIDGEGNFVWAKAMGGTDQDFGVSLAFDPGGDGGVYTTGQFLGTVDFDPGDSEFNLTSAGNYDVFISKLDADGNFIWAKRIGDTGDDVGRAIAFDPEGNGSVYTTGQFFGTVDFNPGSDNFTLTAAEDLENFISKLDGSGNFVWAKHKGKVNLSAFDRFGSVTLDPDGSGEVFITGPFQGTENFELGDSIATLFSNGNSDVFISKLSDAGEFKWAGAIGGSNQDDCIDIAVQPGGNGNVFTLGMFKDSADFNPGPDSFFLTSEGAQDLFISKLDHAGNFQWVKTVKGIANAYGQGMVADSQSVYVSGAFFGASISFDNITLTNVNPSGPDLFMAKLDFLVATTDLNSKAQKINLYPNPASNALTIEVDGEEFFNVDITMFNLLGEVVYFIPNENIIQTKTIDISRLTPGIYFFELKLDGSIVVEKVVKQ